ncbi:hypothetical protein [Gorillibacterium sp. sgz5001074]|uniref:hypothetical protein n=1 Tax=Gorillibacterium sp. sgz5001074 TaxID=3446695 RepID=UPI003F67C1CB
MRRGIVIIVFAIALMVISGCREANRTISLSNTVGEQILSWKEYKNDEVKVKYPENWVFVDPATEDMPKQHMAGFYDNDSETVEGTFSTFVVVAKFEYDYFVSSADELALRYLKIYKSSASEFKTYKQKAFEFLKPEDVGSGSDQKPGLLTASFFDGRDGNKYIQNLLIVPQGKDVYILSTLALESDYAKLEPIFHSMMSTFKLRVMPENA